MPAVLDKWFIDAILVHARVALGAGGERPLVGLDHAQQRAALPGREGDPLVPRAGFGNPPIMGRAPG